MTATAQKVQRPEVTYIASPTCSRFHGSSAFVRGLMGPIGSGKSVACCVEMLQRAQQQNPGLDGVRRSKWAAIRSTYPQLKSTTIQTWLNWFRPITQMKYDSPIEGIVRHPMADGTRVELTILFLALDLPQDREKLTSLELTGAWINEARELDWDIVTEVPSRLRRYPNDEMSGFWSWSGMIMDTNPPTDDSRWYKTFETECPTNWELFRQPGALVARPHGKTYLYDRNPGAENVEHLRDRSRPAGVDNTGYEYYEGMIGLERESVEGVVGLGLPVVNGVAVGKQKGTNYSKGHDWIGVMCEGKYGICFDGKAVYRDVWDDSVHLSKVPLPILKDVPIRLGWDFGLTPACIIGQMSPRGQLRILREVVGTDMALRQFIREHLRPVLENEFRGLAIISTCDPAGLQRGQVDAVTCLSELFAEGIPTEAAPTNDFPLRRDAVTEFLTRRLGDEAGLVLDPSCQILRKGFNGGYHYKRMQVSGENRYSESANKNEYSHPHDGLQYLCLSADERRKSHRKVTTGARRVASWGGV